MSGRTLAAQGFPLTLSLSKGERKAFFNGLSGSIEGKVVVEYCSEALL